MNIEQKLVSSVIGGLKALYGQDVPAAQVQLQKTKKEFEGHLTLVVFPICIILPCQFFTDMNRGATFKTVSE